MARIGEIELINFASGVLQDIIVRAETSGGEDYLESEFTRWMLETLTEAGEIDDEWEVSYFSGRGAKATAYGLSLDGDTLFLGSTLFTQAQPPRSVTKTELATGFKRLTGFLEKVSSGSFRDLEESSAAFEMVDQIRAWLPAVRRVRFLFFSDGFAPEVVLGDDTVGGLPASYHVWDILRVFRCLSSGHRQEQVDIDLSELAGEPLPFLRMPASSDEYSSYLLMIPGPVLFAIYDKYGSRLLERNVRSFLQARGKVNKGVRETILKNPRRFLAYNNGISATAASVATGPREDGRSGITIVRDFQVVNGAQTTASIYHAVRKDRADVSDIAVQAKLTVVDAAALDELVPLISRYANSQNKVNEADFFANDPFHVELEALSRIIWTPPAPGTQRQTRWFYERARGQYADALAKESTAARRKQFQVIHPPKQRFTKTDLAKFENSWNQLPFFVARGSEKNFKEFTILARDRGQQAPTEDYFRKLIGKAILLKETERVVTSLNFGGYRSQVVTYTVAYLSHASAMRVDLDAIWKLQAVPDGDLAALEPVARAVHSEITQPPGGQNVAEWCKKEVCWNAVRALAIAMPSELIESWSEAIPQSPKSNPNHVTTAEADSIAAASRITPDRWFAIAGWAKETRNLQPWQRGLAYSLGRLAAAGRAPSPKQAQQGEKILNEALRLGFKDNFEGDQ